jgi:hypothetical protein
MNTSFVFRLTRLVEAAVAREGTPNRLADRIDTMHRGAGVRCRIRRGALVKLRNCPEVKSGRGSCFFSGKRPCPMPAEESAWTLPGISAAQRHAAGSAWLALAGPVRPVAFAAANQVKRVTTELPAQKKTGSQVLSIPINAKVNGDPADKAGGRMRPMNRDISAIISIPIKFHFEEPVQFIVRRL